MKPAKKNPSSGKTPLNETDVEMWQTMSQHQTLSYQSRREVLAHFLPRYRSASCPQKSLLLDAFVKITGYTRKSALRLLNHPPENTGPIRRPRLPVYGSEVQQALFAAWKAAAHLCAKRLVPYLPTLVAGLERCAEMQLSEEHKRHLLAMSV